MKRLSLFLVSAVLAGCASTSPAPAFHGVAGIVEQRTGQRIRWEQGSDADRDVALALRGLLDRDLTLEAAVQVALLKNPSLIATYEDLSVAQADLVQAGLLKNPVLSGQITTAEREALDPNLIVGLTQDFLDIFMLPARKRVAKSMLEETKFRVGDAVLALAAEVRSAFISLQGAQQVLAMRRVIAGSAQVSADLATKQKEAGNLNDLDLSTERGVNEQTQLEVARSEADVVAARERLTRLMGLWGADTSFRVTAMLPDVPPREPNLRHVESLAIAQRLDLAALRQQTATMAYALALSKSSRWTGVVEVGVDVARLRDGAIAVGPRASIEIPLFDQRQAAIARLEAYLRRTERERDARAIEIRSDARAARARLDAARTVAVRYHDTLIPLREHIVQLSQTEYDSMLLGVYQLILAKQAEVNAYREYIESVRDYWIARSDLERAVGGRIAVPSKVNQ